MPGSGSAVTVTAFSLSSGSRAASPGGGGWRVENWVCVSVVDGGYATGFVNVPVISSPTKLTLVTLPASTCAMKVGS